MNGGAGDAPPPPPQANGGEYLLSLIQRPPHHHHPPPPPQQRPPTLDPAVAAVGPTVPAASPWPSNGGDPQPHLLPWSHNTLSPPYPPSLFGLPHNPFPPPRVPGNQHPLVPIAAGNAGVSFGDDLRRLGFSIDNLGNGVDVDGYVQQQKLKQKIKFGSLPIDAFSPEISSNGDYALLNLNRSYNGFDRNLQLEQKKATSNVYSSVNVAPNANHHVFDQESRWGGGGNSYHSGNHRSMLSPETRRPPPEFSNKPMGTGYWDSETRRRGSDFSEDREVVNFGAFSARNDNVSTMKERVGTLSAERSNTPGNVVRSDIEESRSNFQSSIVEDGVRDKYRGVNRSKKEDLHDSGRGGDELDDLGEQFVDSLLLKDESEDKNNSRQRPDSREKDARSDSRGQQLLSQRARMYKRQMICRSDIDSLDVPFLAIYESLIPPQEEKAKQKQLLTLLEKLVSKEWPKARLYLYGSCANSFGVSKSDIDVCLAIEEEDMDKSEILLKLADILQSDNLQNVQALARARVPIVKLMDPVTGISCDICINNLLAVVNTKLLWDYAQIDARLRQLAFIIKHWAKSRGVNKTYQGTLSSYAYVLMCIHFLQQRRPAILPCLQEMETTYSVTLDGIHCAFFDQVEKLHDFGHHNKENIAQLVWGFFKYWAYRHDYPNTAISVRTGSIISKREKDWTRRVGNDRHLICIEDPFEISHDLGRVVDKHSIKVLREEFERAADVMQYDPNPCMKLFEPYVPT